MQYSEADKQFAAGLWQEYAGIIGRNLASYEADASLRQDLAQNVYLALLQSAQRLRQADNLRAYLLRIVHNVATDHVCREARHQWVELDQELTSTQTGPEGQASAEQGREQLLAAVQSLKLPYRQVLVLLLEDFTQGEIAEILGIAEGNVRIRLNRAKAMLKTLLAPGATR